MIQHCSLVVWNKGILSSVKNLHKSRIQVLEDREVTGICNMFPSDKKNRAINNFKITKAWNVKPGLVKVM